MMTAPDERVETVARVLREHWPHWDRCRCGWRTAGDVGRTAIDHRVHLAAAVVAALDDETARLRGSADAWWSEYDRELTAHEATKAEVERLTRIVNGYDRTPAEQRATDAEADLAAARAALDRVRADAWDEGFDAGEPVRDDYSPTNPYRAALDPEEPR